MTQENKTPAIRIALQHTLGNTRIFTFETYVDQQTPVVVMNAIIDRINESVDRQDLKYKLVEIDRYIESLENNLKATQEALAKVDSSNGRDIELEGRRAPVKDRAKEKERDAVLANIANQKISIKKVRNDRQVFLGNLTAMNEKYKGDNLVNPEIHRSVRDGEANS